MSEATFKLGDVAHLLAEEKTDWRFLFEAEVRRNKSLSGQVSSLSDKLRDATSQRIDDTVNRKREAAFVGRLGDMRRAIAARLLASMVIKSGTPEDWFTASCEAVDGSDALLAALLETKPITTKGSR